MGSALITCPASPAPLPPSPPPPLPQVVAKEDDYSVAETLGRYVASLQPQLVFLGTNSLCEQEGVGGSEEQGRAWGGGGQQQPVLARGGRGVGWVGGGAHPGLTVRQVV